jgi:ribosome-associated protein
MTKRKLSDSESIARFAVEGMKEKKGHDIVMIDLRGLHASVADFYVICHGDSDKQVEALADSVESFVKKGLKENPYSREGQRNAEWVLIDYINVVIHIFVKDKRHHYGIETLWGDGKFTEYADEY